MSDNDRSEPNDESTIERSSDPVPTPVRHRVDDLMPATDRPTRRGVLKAIGAVSLVPGLSAVTSSSAAASVSITGKYAGDKAGLYYVRQVDDHPSSVDQPLVFTYGEMFPQDRDGIPCEVPPSANVFLGRRFDDEIVGRWIDVPKGINTNVGPSYELEIQGLNSSDSLTLHHTGGPGNNDVFTAYPTRKCDGDICEITHPDFPANPPNVAAFRAWPRGTRIGVTGTWTADDGGTYYLRQLDRDGFRNVVVWFGENQGSFSNVFWGTLDGGRKISGMWADVPKTHMRNAGTLELEIRNDGTLEKTDQTGAIFGGTRWKRRTPICPGQRTIGAAAGNEPDGDVLEPQPGVDPTDVGGSFDEVSTVNDDS